MGRGRFIHGHATRDSRSSEYAAYHNAKNRCHDPRNLMFYYYGYRGIEFRFESFAKFLAEIGNKPSSEYSLDRIDPNGHYEVGNVRWATPKEQSHNKRSKEEVKRMVNIFSLEPLTLEEAMKRATSQMPKRIQILDDELMSGKKDSDVIYATRSGYRFRIEISKRISVAKDRRFVAICFADGKKHRYYGERPSHAYGRLIGGSLIWTATRMQFEKHSPDR